MTTWLDCFVLDVGREVADALVAQGKTDDPQAKNPLLAMIATANRAAVILAASPDGVGINTAFDGQIARLFLDQGGHCDRYIAAWQFDRATIDGFMGLKLTTEMSRKAELFVAQYLVAYLDFADHGFPINDALEISAIALLSLRTDGNLAAPRVFAVLSPRGEFSRRLLTWIWGSFDDVVASDALPPLSGPPNQQPVCAELLQAAGVTAAEVARKVQQMVVAGCWHAACEHERGFANHLRKVDVREAEQMGEQDAFLPSGSTFFNVARLPAIPAPLASVRSKRARKTRTYPAILIDPYHRSVHAIQVADALNSLQGAIGGDIEFALDFPNGDILYVDGEGLFKHRLSYEIDGHSFPGWGLIVGAHGPEYDLAAVKSSTDDVIRRIKFSEPDPRLGTNRVLEITV